MSEQINIEVRGRPHSLRETARWLRSSSDSTDASLTLAQRARSSSESGWEGAAADSFRGFMGKANPEIDAVAKRLGEMASALEVHADDLDTVRGLMDDARRVAIKGELVVQGDVIFGPGPAPAEPGKLPSNATPEQRQAHGAAAQEMALYVKKVKAFRDAVELADQGRKKEIESQDVLTKFFDNYTEKVWFNAADTFSAAVGGVVARSSKFFTMADVAANRAAIYGGWATDPTF